MPPAVERNVVPLRKGGAEVSAAEALARGVGRRLSEGLAIFRKFFIERITEVNNTSNREVMAAATSLGRMVERATKHAGRVRGMLAQVEGTDGEGGVATAISRQTEILRRFAQSVSRDIAHQESSAGRAQEHLARITRAASDTARLAVSARLLALNARIEASRLRGTDKTFHTISLEMQNLADQIAQANTLVDELALSLSQALPEVANSAQALRASSEELNRDLLASTAELDHEAARLRDLARTVLHESDVEVEAMITTSHEALSHLQFQDTVAQGLVRLDQKIFDLQVNQARELGLGDVSETIPQPVHVELGGEKKVDAETAGELVMF